MTLGAVLRLVLKCYVVPGRHPGQGPEKPLCCWV